MSHRVLPRTKTMPPPDPAEWIHYARGNLEAAVAFLRESAKCRSDSVERVSVLLGALFSYSRPFTERAEPVFNQLPEHRLCFLALAADLGTDLHLHARLLRVRDELIARSDFVPVVYSWRSHPEQFNARRFDYPDPAFARLIGALNRIAFQRIAISMRLACDFFRSEVESRRL